MKTIRHTDGKANARGGYVDWHLCPTRQSGGVVFTWRPWSELLCSCCRKAVLGLSLPVGTYPPEEVEIVEPLP